MNYNLGMNHNRSIWADVEGDVIILHIFNLTKPKPYRTKKKLGIVTVKNWDSLKLGKSFLSMEAIISNDKISYASIHYRLWALAVFIVMFILELT